MIASLLRALLIFRSTLKNLAHWNLLYLLRKSEIELGH